VFGTRPEIIKLAGVIDELGERALLVHTGQHFSPALSKSIAADVGIGEADLTLEIGGETRGQQIGHATAALDQVFRQLRPVAAIVQGDTNSALAGALAANATETPLVHIEAGLRSHDRAMPEEHNRVLIDHIADLCCAPTTQSEENLLAEGVSPERVAVTGNTVVEAVQRILPPRAERDALVADLGLVDRAFVLATFHRPENVDEGEVLRALLEQLGSLELPCVLPLHPRTGARVAQFGLEHLLEPLRVIEPLGYRDFLSLTAASAFLISDSGGIQEEVSVLKRGVIVVRRSTERPEVEGTFAERISAPAAIGEAAGRWVRDRHRLDRELADLASPYGDGTASAQSVAALERMLERGAA
jgi:UDP-N-acetylglucosamine 2-epimerase (non-hydrolysing)